MSRNFAAPVSLITIAAILTVGLAAATIVLALSGPWLGVMFDRNHEGEGIRVEEVQQHSPAQGKLHAGDLIVALQTPHSGRLAVTSLVTQEEPDQLDCYADYNAFFAQQQAVWEVISSPAFEVILSDGRSVTLVPEKSYSVTRLPWPFWWLLFFGGASFLIGVSTWSMRPDEAVTRALAVSGIGFMLGACSCALYIARELVLPAHLFLGLAGLNHLGIMMFAYAAILFFWYYPHKLGNAPAAWIYVVWVSLLWLNETMQWLSWPGHAFYAHFMVAYCLLFLFSYLQWHQSRGILAERALMKWLMMVMVLNLGITLVLFYGPVILTGKPIATTVMTFGSVFLFYVGLVVGNVRYHQFDMDHWWFRAWQCLIFILVALAADTLFVYFLNMTNTESLGLAVVVGGLYLLLRQWFWKRFSGSRSNVLDHALPHLVETLMLQQANSSPEFQWQQLIMRVFNPISVTACPATCTEVAISRKGMMLSLPSLDGISSLDAFCCERGNRLFAVADVFLGNRLLELMRHSSDLLMAQEQGMLKERRRIQRDLHDDVAARLLSLLHQTREPQISTVAQSALRGLRDVIHRLDDESATLMDVLSDIEASAREQLCGRELSFKWHSPDRLPAITLSSGQHINLRRIARESVANALRHAHPANIILKVWLGDDMLSLSVSNDGAISDPTGWSANRGLNNIKSRVAEMGGSHKWVIEQTTTGERYCTLVVNVPLPLSDPS